MNSLRDDRQGGRDGPGKALDLIASASERYSAADVAQVVIKSRKLAASRGAGNTSEGDYFTMLAVQACNDTDLLPPPFAALLDDRATLARQIQDQEPGGRRKVDL